MAVGEIIFPARRESPYKGVNIIGNRKLLKVKATRHLDNDGLARAARGGEEVKLSSCSGERY